MNYPSLQKLIARAEEAGISLGALALMDMAKENGTTPIEEFSQMEYALTVMRESVENGCAPDLCSGSGLTGPFASRVKEARQQGIVPDDLLTEVIQNALAVAACNACMGRIVAAPTAGACGILPAVILAVQRRFALSEEQSVMGLFAAGAVGMVIAKRATLAGATGGCQAECGSAAAMAAAAMVQMRGGTPAQCGSAAALALKSCIGLVCDPVAGLVEVPCVKRNAALASVALAAATMALCGVESYIPVDEVIDTMGRVGRSLPEQLRETGEGGIAATPTGKSVEKRLRQDF